ncbi:MAG: DUF2232 domain-containing protein [Candidatus Saccharibacteria bacterium]
MNKLFAVFGYAIALFILCLGIIRIPNLESIWAIMVIVLLVVAARRGRAWLLIMLVAVCAVAIPSYGYHSLAFLLVSAIPGTAMGLGIRRWPRFSQIMALGFVGAAAGLGIWWLYLYTHGANVGMHWFEQLFAEAGKAFLASPEVKDAIAQQNLTMDQMQMLFKEASARLARVRYGFYIMQEWIKVFVALLIVRVLSNSEEQLTIRPFSQQQMAWQLDYLIISAFALILAGGQWGLKWAELAGSNVIFILAPITVYYGLAVAFFHLSNWKMNFWLIVGLSLFLPLLIMTPVFLPQFLIFFAVLGIFDPLLDYRNFEHEKEDPK